MVIWDRLSLLNCWALSKLNHCHLSSNHAFLLAQCNHACSRKNYNSSSQSISVPLPLNCVECFTCIDDFLWCKCVYSILHRSISSIIVSLFLVLQFPAFLLQVDSAMLKEKLTRSVEKCCSSKLNVSSCILNSFLCLLLLAKNCNTINTLK